MKKSLISRFPALSENAVLRYLAFSALYFAQGVPEGLLLFGLPAWMAMNGLSPAEIGSYVAITLIPWSFKILAAPLMDRFTFLPMGRRRPWIIFGQFGLMASFLSMAFIPDPLNNLTMLMVAGFTVSLFTIFQDIAVDGMAIDILPVDQQARANGLMWGSKTLGISASVAAGTYIINAYSFFYAVASFSSIILLIMLVPVFLRERPGEKIMPWTKGEASEVSNKLQLHSWKAILKSLYQVFFLRVSIIMGVAVFSYSIGRGLIRAILPVFTVLELGWTDTLYSQIFATTNLISGILGMFVAGALIDFFGKIRMMTIYLICLIALISVMTFMKDYWQYDVFTYGLFAGFFILDTFITIAIFATAMQLCWKRISATQFTLFMAIANLGLATGAKILGPLREVLPWEYVIFTFTGFAVVMLVLIRHIHFDNHLMKVTRLEALQLADDDKAVLLAPVIIPATSE
ncbi:MAG: MFS transporter [Bacteroidota bacterium]|nr:MFS transporter [Bacteroidota bacterium]